jgi:hypothetical protein
MSSDRIAKRVLKYQSKGTEIRERLCNGRRILFLIFLTVLTRPNVGENDDDDNNNDIKWYKCRSHLRSSFLHNPVITE